MEYRPLTDREIIERCCLNLTETYFALARCAPGFRIYEDEGMVGCFSDLDHPAANFVMVARPTPRSLQRLAALPQRNNMMLYLLPTSESDGVVEILERSDFQFVNRLNLMFYRGEPRTSALKLESMKGYSARFDCSLFLAKQFFSHVPEEFSKQIAGLTAGSKCELMRSALGDLGAMTYQVTDTLGLYNIAVSAERRSRGVGSDLVNALLAKAYESKLHAVLQCNDSLLEWYERQGFRRYDEVLLFRCAL